MDRRAFLQAAAGAAALAATVRMNAAAGGEGETTATDSTKPHTKWRKALKYTMLPEKMSDEDKFKLAKQCGFEGIDGSPMDDLEAAKRQGELAAKLGVPIHGLVFGGWQAPLSDPDPNVVSKGIKGMTNALRCAKAVGANTVLLVPAIVNEKVRYSEAYERSQENIRKLLPVAEETGVTIAIENVWNKFLLSPLEFARYIDEISSPLVKAYFDVGNVIIFGYSQDWIRTLGKRIVKLDIKDFKRDGYKWVNLGDGDVNWKAVRQSLDEIGYQGWMTVELNNGDQAYLTDVAARLDKVIEGTI